MVAQAGGYYEEPFSGDRGITKGDPLFPAIFNVVVDAVVRHWEYLVAEREGGDIRDDNGDTAQTSGRKIWERDDGQRQVEEGHARLTVKAA